MDIEPTFTDPAARRLGEALFERRKRLGMTQVDLAEKAKVPQSTISRVESGEAIPSLATLNKLRAALGMTDGEYLLLIGAVA